jgi:hypothetical protein
MFGFVQSAVGRCWSSKDLQLRRISFVLRPPEMLLLHEKPTNVTKLLRASARYLSLRLPVQPIHFFSLPEVMVPPRL